MSQRRLPSIVVLVFLLTLNYQTVNSAPPAKTGEVILLSGAKSDEYWREDEKLEVLGSRGFFAFGFISLTPRLVASEPINVEVWGRGISKFEFFDLTPLADTLAGVTSAKDIRALLLPAATKASSDRDELERLLGQPTSARDSAMTWRRSVAYKQMQLLNLKSFDGLWPIYERQRDFIAKPWDIEIKPEIVLGLYGLNSPTGPEQADAAKSLSYFIRLLNQNKLLVPVLRTKLPGQESRVIGYVVQLPEGAAKKTSGQILVSANRLEPESVTINLEMERPDSIFDSRTKFFGAIVTPTITGLAGTLLGAVIGFLVFVAQQSYNQKREVEKKFEEKKKEISAAIRSFLTTDYLDFLESNSPAEEQKNVAAIRRAFIEKGIYATLPAAEAWEFNRICDLKNSYKPGERLTALCNLVKRRFSDLMV